MRYSAMTETERRTVGELLSLVLEEKWKAISDDTDNPTKLLDMILTWAPFKEYIINIGDIFVITLRFITGQIHLNTFPNKHLIIIIKLSYLTNIDTVCQLRNSFRNISGHFKNPFSDLSRIVK